jgi:RimJ/RimL family protein N-acetyltransferase
MHYLLKNIETERLLFTKIDRSHFDQWITFFQDPKSFEHWKAVLQSPEIECQRWYDKQFSRYATDAGGMNALIEKRTGKLIGHCGLLVQQVDGNTELEIGYSLIPAFWNKGYATEAARACKEYAFENEFSSSLISIISLSNESSIHVAVKNGMKPDTQTVYNNNDVCIYRITQDEWQSQKIFE